MTPARSFYAAEDRAKKATVQLLVLYFLAIAFVVVVTSAVVSIVISLYESNYNHSSFLLIFSYALPITALVVVTAILVATIQKSLELRGGGIVFGALLGGHLLEGQLTDPDEIRLKDVVDEMALAAGVKTPDIILLENEPGINAFAAGTNNKDAAIGVTKGCLTQLTRDELQAIVAHEFSHILHNDTTLNTRAYAIVFGLLAISVVGSNMVNAVTFSTGRSTRGSSAVFPFLLVGFLLIVIGWLGGLAGRVIRAAIVRQREFLADSSAVQYTRNADAVASALYKMATCGSHLQHRTAEEAEHFLFGTAILTAWGQNKLTRTHPKTLERIEAVRPGYEPSASGATPTEQLYDDEAGYGTAVEPMADEFIDPSTGNILQPDLLDPTFTSLGGGSRQVEFQPSDFDLGLLSVTPKPTHSVPISTPQPSSLADAGLPFIAQSEPQTQPKPKAWIVPNAAPSDVVSSIPEQLRLASSDTKFAPALCYSIAAADFPLDRCLQLTGPLEDKEFAGRINALLPKIKTVRMKPRLALLDSAIPTLQAASSDASRDLQRDIANILEFSDQPDFIAMSVSWRLTRYLRLSPPQAQTGNSWDERAANIAVLIAIVSRLECSGEVGAESSYSSVGHCFRQFGSLPAMPSAANARQKQMQAALTSLAASSAEIRDATVSAASEIISMHEIPTDGGDIVMRLICDAADQNIPSLFDHWV